MSNIIFFEPEGPFNINDLSDDIPQDIKKIKIFDVKTLDQATSKDLTFLNSIKYKNHANKTKASVCITKKNLEQFLPKKCIKIFVKNVLYSTAKITKKFYPMADIDYPDDTLRDTKNLS